MTTASKQRINAHIDGSGVRIALAVSKFNGDITEKLLAGAESCLRRHNVRSRDISVYRCPGAFELPLAAQMIAETGMWDAVVCLGAVVRGETPHFEYVSMGAALGIQAAGLRLSLPVTFGVLTTDTVEQALERAGGKLGNKGWDAALAALEMVTLRRSIGVRRKSVRGRKS